jgi:Uma2 family endonuclease
VLDSSAGFWMFNRNCRAPTFLSFPLRLAALGFKPNEKRFFPGAPDFAVEVLSDNNTRAEMNERLKDFFASGTQLAWVVDPDHQRVEVCQSLTQRQLIGSGGVLDGGSLLPGFRFPVADLFKEWDWE